MTSEIPLRARVWRLSSAEYTAVLREAEELVEPFQQSYIHESSAHARERLESARERGELFLTREELEVADAEARAASRMAPRWHLTTKRDRTDRPEGSIDDLGPTIDVPEVYSYASVLVRGDEHSIDVTLSGGEAHILIKGSNPKFLRQAQSWAETTLRKYRPWWWWTTYWAVGLVGIALAQGVYWALASWLTATGLPPAASALLAFAANGLILAAVLITVSRPRTLISFPERRARTWLKEAGLLLAGAVLGQVVASVWALVTG